MTRLTKAIKEQIIGAAIEQAGINKLMADVIQRRAKLAEDIRVDTLGGKDAILSMEKLAKKIKKQQDVFVRVKSNTFGVYSQGALTYCNLGGSRVHLYFNGKIKGGEPYIKKSPIPDEVVYPGDHEFVNEFHSITKLSNDTQSRAEALSLQVMSSIDSFTTIKKLLDAWPEAKDLLPKKLEESKSNLPAIRVKDLNLLIGLPKGDK